MKTVFSLRQAEMEIFGNNDKDTIVHQCLWHHWQMCSWSMCYDIGVLEFVWRWNGYFFVKMLYLERHKRT